MTRVPAWSFRGKASTRVILSPVGAGRQSKRTPHFEVTSSFTLATIRASGPCALAQSRDHRHTSEAARVRPGAVVGVVGTVLELLGPLVLGRRSVRPRC